MVRLYPTHRARRPGGITVKLTKADYAGLGQSLPCLTEGHYWTLNGAFRCPGFKGGGCKSMAIAKLIPMVVGESTRHFDGLHTSEASLASLSAEEPAGCHLIKEVAALEDPTVLLVGRGSYGSRDSDGLGRPVNSLLKARPKVDGSGKVLTFCLSSD